MCDTRGVILAPDSMPSSLSQEFLLCFAYVSLCKTYYPRAGPFLNQATFNKLSRGLLDDNTCTY